MELEQNLIRQILLGQKELFEQIVLKYQNLVFTVCLSITGDRHDAENMAQEAFLAAYCALPSFSGSNFKSWLCKIAVNKSIDFKRKQSKTDAAYCALDESMADGGGSVEDTVILNERRGKLEGILTGMPVKYSMVIRAFYYDGLPVKEISRQFGMQEKTVETRLYRARRMIKERWGEDGI